MNAIIEKLNDLQHNECTGLMTHVVVGYPSLEANVSVVQAMARAGADFVELQLPFSDPVADGPTMMRANDLSLSGGTKVADAFALVRRLRETVAIPLLLMSYFNLVHSYGVEAFCAEAAATGVSGLLIPDMPIQEEETEKLFATAERFGLLNVCFVSPATTSARLEQIAKFARGFVYCFATYGVTGARETLDPELVTYLERTKLTLQLPLAVGFGIKKRSQVEQIAPLAEVAIVGSAMLDRYDTLPEGKKLEGIEALVRELKV